MKNHLFFSQRFWKDALSKKIPLEYELSCIMRKDNISFFEKKIWFYSLDGKWKIFLNKNTWKYDISCKCFEKMLFPKNCTGIWSFLYYQKKMIFLFSRIHDLIIYFLTLNWYVQIFLYHCKLHFLQIKSAQVCALLNAGDSIKTNNIINWSMSFLEKCKNVFR